MKRRSTPFLVIAGQERLCDGEYGRLRDVRKGPNGRLYVLTSNRDGRLPLRPHGDVNEPERVEKVREIVPRRHRPRTDS